MNSQQQLNAGLNKINQLLKALSFVERSGWVSSVIGTQVRAVLPESKLGELCSIEAEDGKYILAEVVGFEQGDTLLATLAPPEGVAFESKVLPMGITHRISTDGDLNGLILDGVGRHLATGQGGVLLAQQGKNRPINDTKAVISEAVPATEKVRIVNPLYTGVRVIDCFMTIGEGQRIGLFAGAGCGKTTLLLTLARGCNADVIVFSLIGERGRELKEFLEHELDDELKSRTIMVCATSDRSSMERSRAAFTATAIAESLRDKGKKVLLLVDSLTRFARAQREIGLANGEPPAKGGFPPSVYTMLPKLIERAGITTKGSITAIYTVLVEGEANSDPIAEEAKSLLDGHIYLSRKLAEANHYPAVDVLRSISRIMGNVVEKEHVGISGKLRSLMAAYEDVELLIRLGEYKEGADPLTDKAVKAYDPIKKFCQQGTRDTTDIAETRDVMNDLCHAINI